MKVPDSCTSILARRADHPGESPHLFHCRLAGRYLPLGICFGKKNEGFWTFGILLLENLVFAEFFFVFFCGHC